MCTTARVLYDDVNITAPHPYGTSHCRGKYNCCVSRNNTRLRPVYIRMGSAFFFGSFSFAAGFCSFAAGFCFFSFVGFSVVGGLVAYVLVLPKLNLANARVRRAELVVRVSNGSIFVVVASKRGEGSGRGLVVGEYEFNVPLTFRRQWAEGDDIQSQTRWR